jgi:Ni2+-binding GTPase involved in maturation of urease and hydrogenase
MKMITVAGTASCGKTSVIIQLAKEMSSAGIKPAVAKFDCISSVDESVYKEAGITVISGLSGGLCPDHFYVSNIQEAWLWARGEKADVLITESAGLCNRCSPHIKSIPAICVIDNLSGVNTPHKIGPMLRTADIVVITKGDIVSQAEREVFAFKVRQANPKCRICSVNGLTGQGTFPLFKQLSESRDVEDIENLLLRFTMPAALCSYCLGERKVGYDYQIGNTKSVNFSNREF